VVFSMVHKKQDTEIQDTKTQGAKEAASPEMLHAH
jgi:hypothetical protein